MTGRFRISTDNWDYLRNFKNTDCVTKTTQQQQHTTTKLCGSALPEATRPTSLVLQRQVLCGRQNIHINVYTNIHWFVVVVMFTLSCVQFFQTMYRNNGQTAHASTLQYASPITHHNNCIFHLYEYLFKFFIFYCFAN